MMWRRFLVSVLAALYFGALVGLAFVPGSLANRGGWIWPIVGFLPVGILLLLLLGRRRWWAAIAFSALGAAWLEAAQTVWMPVGYANAADVIWGSVGAVLGVTLAFALTSRRAVSIASRSMRSHKTPRIVAQAGSTEIAQD